MTPNQQLAEQFNAIAQQLPQATNLGKSRDERDVYHLFDQVVAILTSELPALACRVGCTSCCHHPPLVSGVEWQTLYREILALPQDAQDRIIAMADLLRPMAPRFAAARAYKMGANVQPVKRLEAQCPMLLDGGCAAYEGRPLMCRTFGVSAKAFNGEMVFMGSDLAMDHLRTIRPAGVSLPGAEPYERQVNALNGDGTVAFIPQWLWAHIEDGRFRDDCLTDPGC